MKKVKIVHKTWRRVAISVFGILIIVWIWRWSVAHLYTLPEHSIAAFSSITASAFYTISVVVVFLVTGLTFFSWTQSTSVAASVTDALHNMMKKKEEDDDKKTPTRSDHYDEEED